MKYFFYLAYLVLFFFATAYADPQLSRYEDLRGRSMSIRNTDLQFKRLLEWQVIAKELELWARTNQNREQAADALFNAGVLWRILYQGLKNESFAENAERVWSRVTDLYPNTRQAADALLKIFELFWFDRRDQKSAQYFYQRLVKEYKSTDALAIASEYIQAKDKKKSLKKSTQSETKDAQSKAVIVIDPGHGGEDLGATAQSGLLEKDIVLMISLELERLLKKNLPVTVVLTRRTDTFVPLAARTAIANDKQADLFISLHVNAAPSNKASGLEVYYLDNTNDQASKKLAERENASLEFEGQPDDLLLIMSDMIQNAKLQESIHLAQVFNQQMVNYLKKDWQDIRSLGVKKAPFYVLVGAHMPCVLVELFFINNANDSSKLIKREFRTDLAHGLYHSIKQYLVETGKIS